MQSFRHGSFCMGVPFVFFCVIIGLKALFLVIIAGKGNRDEADGAEGGWESSGSFTGEGSSGEGFSKE